MNSQEDGSEDYFKILISSDNHLGVHDSDALRGNDSFNTFEEILSVGRREHVDFVLLGGDLFHENKPKQSVFKNAVDLLQKCCLGSRPVNFDHLGDPAEDFHGQKIPVVNYKNPNINIDLPIFTIHGNHDDPIGLQPTSVIDILSANYLVNYFGTVNSLMEIKIRPVLLRKGDTYLAIYGLGSIRDERLFRLMKSQQVEFLRPLQHREKWFNIFVIHQNRVKHGPTNYIPEDFLPNFIDLVIWGHEHECRPELEDLSNSSLDEKVTKVLQPGSSVVTQLQPGEAETKHTFVLSVKQKKFKMKKIQLETVRPFIIDQVNLKDILLEENETYRGSQTGSSRKLSFLRSKEAKIENFLIAKIEELMVQANSQLTGHEFQPIEPLIRLKLIYETKEDLKEFNVGQFNRKFLGKIANEDVVRLVRCGGNSNENINFGEEELENIEGMILDEDEHGIELGSHVVSIVEQHFDQERAKGENGNYLRIISERAMSEAVLAATEKQDFGAISAVVDLQMKNVSEYLHRKKVTPASIEDELSTFHGLVLANMEKEMAEVRRELGRRAGPHLAEEDGDDNDGILEEVEDIVDLSSDENEANNRSIRGRGRGSGTSRGVSNTSRTASRGRGRGRSSTKNNTSRRGR